MADFEEFAQNGPGWRRMLACHEAAPAFAGFAEIRNGPGADYAERGSMPKVIRIRVGFFRKPEQSTSPENLAPHWPLRPANFFFSLLVHAGMFSALAFLPPGAAQAEKRVRVVVNEVIQLRKEPLVYWARVPEALPSVSPVTPIGDSQTFRGQEHAKTENVIVQQSNADPARQLVWQPDKPARLTAETPLQNMVAVQGKAVPKPFEPPRVQAPEGPKILPAPEIPSAKTELPAAVAGMTPLAVAKPKPKAFVPPKEQPKLAINAGVVDDAPPELAAAKAPGPGNALGAGALPKRPAPFVPPPARNGGGKTGDGDRKTPIAAPPEISAGGTGSNATAAVIGLNPAERIGALPDGSRPAAFSRAAETGAPSGGRSGQGPVIPGVAIAGNRSAPAPATPRVAPPAPARSFELRVPPTASTMSAPLRPSSRTLPRAIEARFRDRNVYVLVVPKPDLPEYIADWTIWFSERTPDSAATASMRAPVPVRKLIRASALPAGGSAAEDWVQMSAVIGKDGKINSIVPAPGRNPALAAKAAEDLAAWEFRPASRNGEAVEVDVVIEIPFHVR
jgi:hypothetical protein